jgi:bifunctional UDP-N-acetylglucosamine pyrophosphorylase/glucosamine-1-phosphate N-acetyltransferase
MRDVVAVVMAAGAGTRMKSSRAKVLHPVLGRPMLSYVLDLCQRLHAKRTLVVVGYQADAVKDACAGAPAEFVLQAEQRGTAHAVLQAAEALKGFDGTVLVLSGDVPLLREETVRGVLAHHDKTRAAATMLTAALSEPTGYGRVIRGAGGAVLRVVEEVEASARERKVKEVNAGLYAFAAPALLKALTQVRASRVKKEFYLPDVLAALRGRRQKVEAVPAADPGEVLGINTRAELAAAVAVLRQRVLDRLMQEGVTVLDPASTTVEASVSVGRDTVLYPNVILEGQTAIGEGCAIYPGSRLRDTRLGNGVTVLDGCVLTESEIADGCSLGPYAHLRPGSRLKKKAKVGNFCEVKKSVIGEGSKVPHLTYIGDTVMGDRVNIGAGTITCNYDGYAKHQTVIEDEAFVGSNVNLVAPVKVGKGSVIAAGSTVGQEVPPDALAIERAQQVNKEGWAAARRAKMAAAKKAKQEQE